jgi:hypothetical protein
LVLDAQKKGLNMLLNNRSVLTVLLLFVGVVSAGLSSSRPIQPVSNFGVEFPCRFKPVAVVSFTPSYASPTRTCCSTGGAIKWSENQDSVLKYCATCGSQTIYLRKSEHNNIACLLFKMGLPPLMVHSYLKAITQFYKNYGAAAFAIDESSERRLKSLCDAPKTALTARTFVALLGSMPLQEMMLDLLVLLEQQTQKTLRDLDLNWHDNYFATQIRRLRTICCHRVAPDCNYCSMGRNRDIC